ncbi:MAG: hypothetical protein HF976_04195 [ANME-2 cluster archaeon]|nr:hypothetical protein [ANME-2 cluster archaeon]MBC2700605.1 hypothetical protein [ANME-2 cluster archaeon]MBC2747318.1 hypothetical protein [ANME-2 cluster archaeon]
MADMSLPLNLVEEFRHPVVDGLVQTLVNTGSIKEDDFHKENNGAFFLNRDAFKRFLTAYEERMKSFSWIEMKILIPVTASSSRGRS